MSKKIKQLEMDALQGTFKDIRDMVFLSISGVDAISENKTRLELRKKNIRLQMVKNSLAGRVFRQLGMRLRDRHQQTGDTKAKVKGTYWDGPTTIAWGAGSLAELSKELDAAFKKNQKVKFKGALSDGLEISFEQALRMPTRAEALGRVVSLALSPARRLASQILGPASMVASQVKTLGEKKEEGASEEAAPTA
jgi:large subunit ribosomal protein L10